MEKLKLKHLAPYLPYKVKAKNCFNELVEIKGVQCSNESCRNELWLFVKDKIYLTGYLYQCKPILRPLSDLFNGNYESILDEFSEVSLENFKIAFLSELKPLNAFDKINHTIAVKLFENHFDLFGLIEKGLAIDINQLK